MDIINLGSYIREGRFLSDTVLPYDLIVREKLPAELNDTKHKHQTFLDVGYDFGLSGQMTALSNEYKNILLIVESLNMLYLLPRLQQLPEGFHVAVVNLASGIASYLAKSLPELDDVSLLFGHITLKEVRDAESLRNALKAGGKQYIKIPVSEVPEKFFAKGFDYENGIGDLRSQSFEGIGGTVLAPGGMLVHAIHAVQQLQDE